MKMKKSILLVMLALVAAMCFGSGGASSNSEVRDKAIVQNQQQHYQKVHALPFFDYSIPRDIYTQIYEVVTQKAYVTYTVIESITGETFFHGPSIGYGIPADTSLTNPLQTYKGYESITTIEQAEPNGLFSSKNTDGTWVLFVQGDGSVTPIYTEHKVTTFPFVVVPTTFGWVRADADPVEFTVDLK